MRNITKITIILSLLVMALGYQVAGICALTRINCADEMSCTCKPSTCAECLWLCQNCDGPPTYTCDEPTADSIPAHPCHTYCG